MPKFKGTCKTPGCNRPAYIKWCMLCNTCYMKSRELDESCQTPGCDKPALVKWCMLCDNCYRKDKQERHSEGNFKDMRGTKILPGEKCKNGCDRPVCAKHMCNPCYQRHIDALHKKGIYVLGKRVIKDKPVKKKNLCIARKPSINTPMDAFLYGKR